jgi:hypothetical protein
VTAEEYRCAYCDCLDLTVHVDTRKEARALESVWSMRRSEFMTGNKSWAVPVPFQLARLDREMELGLHPQLLDDCLPIEEVATLAGCPVEAIQRVIEAGLVPATAVVTWDDGKMDDDEIYIRRSALKAASPTAKRASVLKLVA